MGKVLIVEDEKILLEMYKDKLEKEGFDVIFATTSEDGIDLAKKEKPDLIILDVLLPKENGISFLKHQKDIPEISSIPVVILSNFDEQETKKEAISLGAKDYLIKSNLDPKQTVEQIKRYL